jgi:hypothetical protein
MPEAALDGGQVFPLPLQPPSNYRRRMLDHLHDWLPREKLYAIPRSLQPQGSRALGRLAFSDNFLRFVTRLRREIQMATHPESLAQSLSQTGLSLRESMPRVFVFASAGGGSAGLLPDLGYTLRQVLEQMHLPKGTVTAFLHCGAPDDPATPPIEQANVYATLTELNHFADPNVGFATQYGPDGPKVAGDEAPFHSVYLIQTEHRTPESFQHAVAQLGTYLAHDLTTPLGCRLDRQRDVHPDPLMSPFRSFGTCSVWFPRGLLLRAAARQACQTLLLEWCAPGGPTALQEIEAACSHALNDAGLRWEVLSHQIETAAQTPVDGSPAEALGRFIGRLEEQFTHAAGMPDPGPWTRQAMDQIREWVGLKTSTDPDSVFRSSRITRALSQGVQVAAEQWERKLRGHALELVEFPGRRLANAEAALARMAQFCAEAAEARQRAVLEETARTMQARADLQAALEACNSVAGGFSLFGSRTPRVLRHFMDQLTAFARRRLSEDLLDAGVQFFRKLQGRLEERIRDLSFCRQRLVSLRQTLAGPAEELAQMNGPISLVEVASSPAPLPFGDPVQEAVQDTPTRRVVLPDGESDLDTAASRFLASMIRPEHYHRLDRFLQAMVLSPLGGLFNICQKNSDLVRYLANPLIDQATPFLGELMPVTDVAQVEFSTSRIGGEIVERIEGYYTSAEPLVNGSCKQQKSYLMAPATESGDRFAAEAYSKYPELQLLREAHMEGGLIFCREQGRLSLVELDHTLRGCRQAYNELSLLPQTSPHARFDIVQWAPLDLG